MTPQSGPVSHSGQLFGNPDAALVPARRRVLGEDLQRTLGRAVRPDPDRARVDAWRPGDRPWLLSNPLSIEIGGANPASAPSTT